MFISWQDIFQQNINRSGAPFGTSQTLPSAHPKPPLTTPHNPGRPPGKKRGPKPKEGPGAGGVGPPGVKKKGQKGKEIKMEAGELDLLEIHTKHTLKKFQPGNKAKNKSKVAYNKDFGLGKSSDILIGISVFVSFQKMDLPGACVEDFEGKINKSKLKLVLTNGKIQGYDSTSQQQYYIPFVFCSINLSFAVLLGRRGADLVTLMEQDALLNSSL